MNENSQSIGVCALVVNDHNQVLLGKRKNSYKAGFYGLPGGRVEINEPLGTAIKREVVEETGLELNNLEYVGAVRDNQGTYDFIHFIFVAKKVNQTPTLCEPEKCEGWEWFDLDKLPANILTGHQAAIELYKSGKILLDLVNN